MFYILTSDIFVFVSELTVEKAFSRHNKNNRLITDINENVKISNHLGNMPSGQNSSYYSKDRTEASNQNEALHENNKAESLEHWKCDVFPKSCTLGYDKHTTFVSCLSISLVLQN